jgi:predicted alpha/beta superfamily hydrolase
MRKTFLLIVFATLVLGARAQTDNKIVIGKIDSLYSNILNEQRKIWVYTPNMTSGNPDTSQRYPVVYLLDGDGHFASVVGLIQQLSQVNGNTIYPEMIVVAIPNTDRTRDLTPTHVSSDPPMMDSNFSKSSGGGGNFISFIEKELMPHIDSAYPTQPYRTLIGHSFGGLMVMDALTNHTKLFNAYIAIDPSMWYDKQQFLKTTEEKLKQKNYDGTKLYVGIANTMPPGMTLDKMKKDTSSDTRHIRSIFALDKFIRENSQNGLKYASKYYPDDNHGSVPLASEYDGFRFIFNYYRLNLTGKDFTDSTAAIVTKFKRHYDTVSKEMGYKVSPGEMFVNFLGYDALSHKYYAKAGALFEMNITNYPQSSNVYDSYGDLFADRKDTVNAITWYKRALEVKEVEDTRRKLNAMEGKEEFKLGDQELQKYVGEFEFESMPLTATLFVRDHALWANVPGEREFELVPAAPDVFSVKGLIGYKVQFEMDAGKAVGFTSSQPNGTFKAHLKK